MRREEEGASQRPAGDGDLDDARRTETGNPDAPLDLDPGGEQLDLDGDDGAPESLDFQTIYNAAFELRRSSLDPGRRAAFEESAEAAVAAAGAGAGAAEAEEGGPSASAAAAAGNGGGGSSPLIVVGSSGDTSAELKLRGKPFLG